MIGALRAELAKLTRHRAVWGLVWILPLGLAAIFAGVVFWSVLHPSVGSPKPITAESWTHDAGGIWSLPRSAPARLLVAAFAALAFGGEYGWNTWKLIVPHSRRTTLIASKYFAVVGLFAASFLLMALVGLVAEYVSLLQRGRSLPPGITASALLDTEGRQALATLATLLLTVSYASTGAVLLRSSLGGTIIAVAALLAEGLSATYAALLDRNIYLALPTHHLLDTISWITRGTPIVRPLPSGVLQHGWMTSVAALSAWIAGLVALTTLAFERQDLN